MLSRYRRGGSRKSLLSAGREGEQGWKHAEDALFTAMLQLIEEAWT
jgi:hypothetical protein